MMEEGFSFHSPVKAHFGFKSLGILTELLKDYDKITVVSGIKSVRRSGFLEFMEKNFTDKSVTWFDQIEENPSINTIIKGGKFARKAGAQVIVAIGGGSPLDAGKAIAAFATNMGGFYETLAEDKLTNEPLPLITIPTTCGTGSEMNNYSIITDVEKRDKINFSKENTFAKHAILDPSLLKSLPENILLATVFDAFTHAMEGFVSKKSNPFSDGLAVNSMEIILSTLATKETNSETALQMYLYASSIAGVVILHTGTTLLHALGYYLTNHKKIHHGTANAILMPYYLQMLVENNVEKAAVIGGLFQRHNLDLNFWLERMNAPALNSVLTDKEIAEMVDYAVGKNNTPLTPFDVEAIKVKNVLLGISG